MICFCKFRRLVPSCPRLVPGGGCQKAQCWRGVPNVPIEPVIEKILTHLGLQARAPPRAPARGGFEQSA